VSADCPLPSAFFFQVNEAVIAHLKEPKYFADVAAPCICTLSYFDAFCRGLVRALRTGNDFQERLLDCSCLSVCGVWKLKLYRPNG